MKEIVFASSNHHKVREVADMLPQKYRLLGLRDIGILEDIPETGNTIAENSFLKAKYVRDRIGSDIPVFADDSGLEVVALDGRPGVHSARYAGWPKNDEANIKKLLLELNNEEDRSARFVTVITLLERWTTKVFEGEVGGSIATEPKGSGGFGYDPVFIPAGNIRTFAEFSPEEKNQISHRAKAMKKLNSYLSVL